MNMPKKLFWRFFIYTSDSSGFHFANTDQVWTRLFGKLWFLIEKGHVYENVVIKILP